MVFVSAEVIYRKFIEYGEAIGANLTTTMLTVMGKNKSQAIIAY